MRSFSRLLPLFLTPFFLITCSSQSVDKEVEGDAERKKDSAAVENVPLKVGAERMASYLPKLEGKKVAIVANPTSKVGDVHLVDTLLARGVELERILSPEHGFRGDAEAGERVKDGKDPRTGLPVVSLYGSHKKPTEQDLRNIDIILFDLQDVGARFYTYISTLHYVMEAAAEQGKELIVLDRPNPNGFYVDGPVLDTAFHSFVGMHPIPIVHGMTIGEYARMIDGEGWLEGGMNCDLEVVECQGYEHSDRYELPVSPSPNLAQMSAIYLYPSLCLFEGTVVSVGRGTERPFTMIGHPDFEGGAHRFVPRSIPGKSTDPKHEGDTCRGFDLNKVGKTRMKEEGELCLSWLIRMYDALKDKTDFFHEERFDRLAGTDSLRIMIQEGKSEEEIRSTWKKGLEEFRSTREEYLLYPE
jgi:uncharacterized protein YbbC (DUF1343 family)